VLPADPVKRRLEALTQFLTDMEKARHSRAHARSLGDSAFFEGLGWFMSRLALLVPIAIAWGLTLVLSETLEPELPQYAALLAVLPWAVALPFAIALFGIAFVFDRFLRKRAIRYRAVQALAERFHGRASDRGTRAAFDWLDAHWAADTPDGAMVTHNSDQGKSVRRWVSWFQYRDRPVLVMLAQAPHVDRFDLFVSAHDRSRVTRTPRPLVDQLGRAGLAVDSDPAGFHVWAGNSDPAYCRPETIEWVLTTCTNATH
jgi:hypothetical protein